MSDDPDESLSRFFLDQFIFFFFFFFSLSPSSDESGTKRGSGPAPALSAAVKEEAEIAATRSSVLSKCLIFLLSSASISLSLRGNLRSSDLNLTVNAGAFPALRVPESLVALKAASLVFSFSMTASLPGQRPLRGLSSDSIFFQQFVFESSQCF